MVVVVVVVVVWYHSLVDCFFRESSSRLRLYDTRTHAHTSTSQIQSFSIRMKKTKFISCVANNDARNVVDFATQAVRKVRVTILLG